MAYVRMFNSAVDPGEVELLRKTFDEDLRPVFEALPGCLSIELLLGIEPNAGGLLDGCVLAHWESIEAIEESYENPEVRAAAVRFRSLLRQEPVINMYRVLD